MVIFLCKNQVVSDLNKYLCPKEIKKYMPIFYLAHAFFVFGLCLFGIWLMPIWYLAHAYLSTQVKEFYENSHEPNLIGFF
jgi:hypothetical protein